MSESSSRENFKRTLASLRRSVSEPVKEPRDLSGIIKDFEMAYELSWKVLKSLLTTEGHETKGAKDVFKMAFKLGYIDQEKIWLEMIQDRNLSAHVYDEKDAKKIADRVRKDYLAVFETLSQTLKI